MHSKLTCAPSTHFADIRLKAKDLRARSTCNVIIVCLIWQLLLYSTLSANPVQACDHKHNQHHIPAYTNSPANRILCISLRVAGIYDMLNSRCARLLGIRQYRPVARQCNQSAQQLPIVRAGSDATVQVRCCLRVCWGIWNIRSIHPWATEMCRLNVRICFLRIHTI